MMHGAIKLHDDFIISSKNTWSDLVHQPQLRDSGKRVERCIESKQWSPCTISRLWRQARRLTVDISFALSTGT